MPWLVKVKSHLQKVRCLNQNAGGIDMPFKSQAQRRALYAKDPKLAKEFESKTPKGKKLPEKVSRSKSKK